MYAKISFGLMNAGENFQRAVDIAFYEEKEIFFVVYMDEITVFSNSSTDHIKHLEQVFLKCTRFGSQLNPKKSNFVIKEGKIWVTLSQRMGLRLIQIE